MLAVIFEVWPDPQHKQSYLDLAATLRKELEAIDGFISVERFQSIAEEGKLLSLSFFDNEEAIQSWRNTLEHRKAQSLGKNGYFANYRLRVAEVLRDYGPLKREQAPQDSKAIHG